jgi:spore coat protein CotH
MKNTIILTLLFFGGFLKIWAQSGSLLFNDTLIHTVEIFTPIEHWFDTLSLDYQQNIKNPDAFPEVYRNCSVKIDGIFMDSCGFRQKGNFSNLTTSFGKKKPLKISFDAFRSQKLQGLRKLNLHNFTNDPALLHDQVAYALFRSQGIPAPRTSYAKVWVNDEYIGVYLNVENVDKSFLKDHFGGTNNNGNLFKTGREAQVSLKYLGENKADYKEKGLTLTTNEAEDDYSGIIRFIDFLNNYKEANFKDSLEKVFDIHAYLKVLAIEKCLKSWDSYWGGGNNFYIYQHPDGQFRWIPWDMNETFQNPKFFANTALFEGYLIPTKNFAEKPLLKRIFEVEEWKQEYLDFVCHFIQNDFSVEKMGNEIVLWHNLIAEEYKKDPNKFNTYKSFEKSLTDWHEDALSVGKTGYALKFTYPGIFPFIQSQRLWAQTQLQGWGMSCDLNEKETYSLDIFPNPVYNTLNIKRKNTDFEYTTIMLYNSQGQMVKYFPFSLYTDENIVISTEELADGLYFLQKIEANGNIGTAKFLKMR